MVFQQGPSKIQDLLTEVGSQFKLTHYLNLHRDGILLTAQ